MVLHLAGARTRKERERWPPENKKRVEKDKKKRAKEREKEKGGGERQVPPMCWTYRCCVALGGWP